jgi:hypothetical protein
MFAQSFQTIGMGWPGWGFPSIVGLCLLGSPYAISRFVVSVIIDAFNSVRWRWAFSHVSNKCCERISPFVAYLNASTSVAGIFWVLRFVTSASHIAPRIVFGGMAHSVRASGVASVTPLFLNTTATTRVIRGNGFDARFEFPSTFAAGKDPESTFPVSVREPDYLRSVHDFASPVFGFWSAHLESIDRNCDFYKGGV